MFVGFSFKEKWKTGKVADSDRKNCDLGKGVLSLFKFLKIIMSMHCV